MPQSVARYILAFHEFLEWSPSAAKRSAFDGWQKLPLSVGKGIRIQLGIILFYGSGSNWFSIAIWPKVVGLICSTRHDSPPSDQVQSPIRWPLATLRCKRHYYIFGNILSGQLLLWLRFIAMCKAQERLWMRKWGDKEPMDLAICCDIASNIHDSHDIYTRDISIAWLPKQDLHNHTTR